MKKHLIAAASLVALLPAAHAVDMKAGDWDLSLGGNINAFYTSSSCKSPTGTVAGLAFGDNAFACGGASNQRSTVIGNGLLPSQLAFGAKSKQNGYDVAANITISVATATDSGLAQNNMVDVRNAYMTVGKSDMGTFKLGRDYGVFGLNAVLNDMTLLGVGAATAATQNGRVSLGHLGSGMLYAQSYGQVTYTTPSANGFSADAGLYSPINTTLGQGQTANGSPQVQGRVNYGAGNFKAWFAAKNQSFAAAGSAPAFTMSGVELGGSYSVNGFGLVANLQRGNGLGILSDGDQGSIRSTHSFVQATYQLTPKDKIGLGWGRSQNDSQPLAVGYNVSTTAALNLKSNTNTTLGLYHSLTSGITLVGEVGTTTSQAFGGNNAKQDSVAAGAIFFF